MSTYNREQVKGILMIALGPLMPHEVAEAHANLVFGIVDRNPEVQWLLSKLADKPEKPCSHTWVGDGVGPARCTLCGIADTDLKEVQL